MDLEISFHYYLKIYKTAVSYLLSLAPRKCPTIWWMNAVHYNFCILQHLNRSLTYVIPNIQAFFHNLGGFSAMARCSFQADSKTVLNNIQGAPIMTSYKTKYQTFLKQGVYTIIYSRWAKQLQKNNLCLCIIL